MFGFIRAHRPVAASYVGKSGAYPQIAEGPPPAFNITAPATYHQNSFGRLRALLIHYHLAVILFASAGGGRASERAALAAEEHAIASLRFAAALRNPVHYSRGKQTKKEERTSELPAGYFVYLVVRFRGFGPC